MDHPYPDRATEPEGRADPSLFLAALKGVWALDGALASLGVSRSKRDVLTGRIIAAIVLASAAGQHCNRRAGVGDLP